MSSADIAARLDAGARRYQETSGTAATTPTTPANLLAAFGSALDGAAAPTAALDTTIDLVSMVESSKPSIPTFDLPQNPRQVLDGILRQAATVQQRPNFTPRTPDALDIDTVQQARLKLAPGRPLDTATLESLARIKAEMPRLGSPGDSRAAGMVDDVLQRHLAAALSQHRSLVTTWANSAPGPSAQLVASFGEEIATAMLREDTTGKLSIGEARKRATAETNRILEHRQFEHARRADYEWRNSFLEGVD